MARYWPGSALPPERELAEQFQVSRPSLREAIGNLQARGLVERKQGGGTFVSRQLNSAMTDPLMALISGRPETQFDLLEFQTCPGGDVGLLRCIAWPT